MNPLPAEYFLASSFLHVGQNIQILSNICHRMAECVQFVIWEPKPLLEWIVTRMGTCVIVGTHSNNCGNWGNCWFTIYIILHYHKNVDFVPFEQEWFKLTISLNHGCYWSNMFILLPMLWHEEQLWNFSVHLSSLVM